MTQIEAEGNGNLRKVEEGGEVEVDAFYIGRRRASRLYVGYAFARVSLEQNRERINFVVDDAFAVTEYYILR